MIEEASILHLKEKPHSVTKLYSLSNSVFKLEFANLAPVVFKIFSKTTENLFLFRCEKFENMIYSNSEFGDFLIFQNEVYRIEKFIENEPISSEKLVSHDTRLIFMRCLARFHTIASADNKEDFFIFDLWKNKYGEIKEKIMSNFSQSDRLQKVAQILSHYESFVQDELSNNQLVGDLKLCHNDILGGNIIFDKLKNQFKLIDFEFSGFGCVYTDIYNFLIESIIEYNDNINFGFAIHQDQFPNNEQLKEIIHFYLFFKKFGEKYKNAQDNQETINQVKQSSEYKQITQADIDAVFKNIFLVGTITNLFWSLWAFYIYGREGIVFKYYEFGFQRYEDFLETLEKHKQVTQSH